MENFIPSALITGGSRGIGYAIAKHLAAQKWALTLTARDREQLKTVCAELKALGGTVQFVAGDAADDDTLQEVVTQHESAYRSMNALILAAGVGSAAPIAGYPMKRFDKQLSVNFRSAFVLVSQALPLLRAGAVADLARGGRIIGLASMEGIYPDRGLSAYSASKAALISLLQAVNVEEAENGISATAISPGFVNTDMSAWTAETIPPDTMITVADIVAVVDLILSLSPNAVLPHVVINRAGGGAFHA